MKAVSLLITLAIHLIVSLAKLAGSGGTRGLLAETLLVKHQLLIVNRTRRRAPNLQAWDRIVLGVCCMLIKPARIAKNAVVVRPATLLKFHEALIKRKYRRLYSSVRQGTPGPKGPSQEIIDAIIAMKTRNRRFGCPRIAQQIAKAFGIEIDRDIVRRVLAKYYHPTPAPSDGGPSWLTFIGHIKDSLWSVDLFRCESIVLKTHWVMLVMDQYTRRIICFGLHVGDVDGVAVCRMFNEVIAIAGAGAGLPKYLSSDNDPLFRYHRWKANLLVLEVDELKAVPHVPLSHPFVERLIGTIRREYFDQVFFWNAVDLERKLRSFQKFYNDHRTHASLDGDTPAEIAGRQPGTTLDINNFSWQQHCGGLFQLPVAA